MPGHRLLKDMNSYITSQEEFNALGDNQSFSNMAEENARIFLAQLASRKIFPSSFLDVGCREGTSLEAVELVLGAILDSSVGIDIVPSHIEKCIASGKEAHIMDMHDMSFGDGEFEAVYCSQTLEHAYDVKKACKELFRVASKAVFIGLPIETEDAFIDNLSHYQYEDNEFGWLSCIYPIPKSWILANFYRSNKDHYINMTFIRKENHG